MKCIWIKVSGEQAFFIEFDANAQRRFASFEAFCDNYRSGWERHGTPQQIRWAVSNGKDIEPLMQEWRAA